MDKPANRFPDVTDRPGRACASGPRLWITAAVLASLPSLAPAQETDADFSAYCRENFSNSSYQRFAQSWGTEHACVQGTTRQGIDFAKACELTTGNRTYREMGNRVLCGGAPSDPAQANADDIGAPDYAAYCRATFPNSSYERQAESPGTPHKCRQPGATGGFTLQSVDAARACEISHGVRSFRLVDRNIVCTGAPATQTATALPGGGGAGAVADAGGADGGSDGGPLPMPLPGAMPMPLPGALPPPAGLGPPPMAMPGQPVDPSQDKTQLACAAFGGNWRAGALPMVEDRIAGMEQEIARGLSVCAEAPNWLECPSQMRIQSLVSGYFESLLVWQCPHYYIQDATATSGEDLEIAATEACQISAVLDDLMVRINEIPGSNMLDPETTPHLMLLGMNEIDPCEPCLKATPGEEVPDLTELVRALAEAEDDLFAEFDMPQDICTDQGALPGAPRTRKAALSPMDFLLQALAAPAHAQSPDPVVSDKKGPFEGRKFGSFRTKQLYFREVQTIRTLQDEMSENGGRDKLLAEKSWAAFEREVAVTIKAMKIEDSAEATIWLKSGIEGIEATRDALRDQLEELEALQERVNRELSGKDYIEFLEALDGLVKKNRQIENPMRTNPHDPTYAQVALLLRTLQVLAKEGAKKFGTAPVGAVLALASIYANACEYLDWSANVSQFERFKKPYMELLDLTSSLTILIEQYKMRIEAQEVLVARLNEEWDEEQKRRRKCKKK